MGRCLTFLQLVLFARGGVSQVVQPLPQSLDAAPMSERTSAFDRALREIAVSALSNHGFTFNGGRTFRRVSVDGRTCPIIDFQLGQRSRAGKFTTNRGVFSEDDQPGLSAHRANVDDCNFGQRRRIGTLIPLRFPTLTSLPWIGFLFGSPDKWWRFSADPSHTNAALSAAVDELIIRGLSWLNAGIEYGQESAKCPIEIR